jgi:hypothetical protein
MPTSKERCQVAVKLGKVKSIVWHNSLAEHWPGKLLFRSLVERQFRFWRLDSAQPHLHGFLRGGERRGCIAISNTHHLPVIVAAWNVAVRARKKSWRSTLGAR